MTRTRGFTLTELLVVITVILLLAGMLAPIIKQVLEQAQQTRCANNLRQVGMVFLTYRNDYETWPVVEGNINLVYPHAIANLATPALPNLLKDYASNTLSIFYCPRNAQKRSASTHWPNAGLAQYSMTYQAMMWADPTRFLVPRPSYQQPGTNMLMLSDIMPSVDTQRLTGAVWSHATGNGCTTVKGMNCSYGDGRVMWQSAATGTWIHWYQDAFNGFHWWALGW